jgi:hypothetical protein
MNLRTVFAFCLPALLLGRPVLAAQEVLRLSVYATAGDVGQHLVTPEGREKVVRVLEPLPVGRLFLEGRRGDEHVAPGQLREVRDFFGARGISCAGGIATVPGSTFGTRQNGGLGWLNWESDQTRRDVAAFFTTNAAVFDELIVDDFFCTGDTSPESERARGARSWGAYRRDLLVSLIEPLIVAPARAAHPQVRLILKYPQWYDRFHLFGYDPQRMSGFFDQVWVGTEVRDPQTRRMGYVAPTEGYVNFRWLSSVAGEKVRGAWFDHIECSDLNFVDQAYQSVLAGARELTLFHLGDLVAGHPGDALLAARWPDLIDLATKVRGQRREGVVFYKPPGSDSDENMYLADYLAMLGWPILPEARYPEEARVVFLAVQAAADPEVLGKVRRHLERGATVVLTPAFVRAAGIAAGKLAGVEVEAASVPTVTRGVEVGRLRLALATPVELDAGLRMAGGQVRVETEVGGRAVPLLTLREVGRGRVFVLNTRTFAEQDYRASGEWLLAPEPRGLTELPEPWAQELRTAFLAPLELDFKAPAGVALYLFSGGCCVYSLCDNPVRLRLQGEALELPPRRWVWRARR